MALPLRTTRTLPIGLQAEVCGLLVPHLEVGVSGNDEEGRARSQSEHKRSYVVGDKSQVGRSRTSVAAVHAVIRSHLQPILERPSR